MESAKDPRDSHRADHLDRSMDGAIFTQRPVRAALLLVGHVSRHNSALLRGAEGRDVVKEFTTDRADQSLGVGILPWRTRCRWLIAGPHRAEALEEYRAVDGIAIAIEMSWCPIPREVLGQLSGDPLGGRTGRDVEPDAPTPRHADNDEPAHETKANRGHREEVNRGYVGRVVAQECPPWATASRHGSKPMIALIKVAFQAPFGPITVPIRFAAILRIT